MKQQGRYKEADTIREQILASGYQINDVANQSSIVKPLKLDKTHRLLSCNDSSRG